MSRNTPNIDVPRLFTDLQMTEADLEKIAALPIPIDVCVTSASAIKIDTVRSTLHIFKPDVSYVAEGVKAPSDVAEQPLGQTAIDGALNRLRNGKLIRNESHADNSSLKAWISIENGLFRVSTGGRPNAKAEEIDGIMQFSEDADLASVFDPTAEYEDRAVAVVHIPGYPTIVQISPSSEAVKFPTEAVHAAFNADGSFKQHTAGSKLAELGLVEDKQNPHTELTSDRIGGPLPRQDQMARTIIRALLHLTQ